MSHQFFGNSQLYNNYYNYTSTKNIDNVMLLGMARQIAKNHGIKEEPALVQSFIKSQNVLLLPFQGSRVIMTIRVHFYL